MTIAAAKPDLKEKHVPARLKSCPDTNRRGAAKPAPAQGVRNHGLDNPQTSRQFWKTRCSRTAPRATPPLTPASTSISAPRPPSWLRKTARSPAWAASIASLMPSPCWTAPSPRTPRSPANGNLRRRAPAQRPVGRRHLSQRARHPLVRARDPEPDAAHERHRHAARAST